MNTDKSVQVSTWKNAKKPLCSVSSGIFYMQCVCVCAVINAALRVRLLLTCMFAALM